MKIDLIVVIFNSKIWHSADNFFGTDNISLGYNSFQNVGSGYQNVIIGNNCGNNLSDKAGNIFIQCRTKKIKILFILS